MAFDIESFKANGLVDGGARPSLFEVILPDWPGSDSTSEQSFRFHCRAANIPPSQLGAVDVPYFGRRIKVVGDRVYADWSVTINHDENYQLREAIESWHVSMNQHIQNTMTNGVTPSPNSYKRDAVVLHYSKSGELIKTYTFVGMFPITITQMGLDWDAVNQYMTFDVDFSIDYWLPRDNDGSSSAASGLIEGARNLGASFS